MHVLLFEIFLGCGGGGSISAVEILPNPIQTNDLAEAHVTVSDDPIVSYQWFVDGVSVSDEDVLSGVLWFEKGQSLSVEAHVGDDEPVSAQVVVSNSPPIIEGVTVSVVEDEYGAEWLLCALGAAPTDPDGDPIATEWSWFVDGVVFDAARTTNNPGDTVSAMDLARGQEWQCTVTVDDGEDEFSLSDSVNQTGPVANGYWFEPVATVDGPVDMLLLEDGTLLIGAQDGDLIRLDPDTGEILGELNLGWDPESELVTIALHPEFGDGVHDYLYTWFNRERNLQRYNLSIEPFEVTDEATILDIGTLGGGHTGGDFLWWTGESDGPILYLAMGPYGPEDAQDETSITRSLIAIDIDDETGEMRPAFEDTGFENPYIVAIGLRNPWRLADCGSVMCIADPGDIDTDEINLYRGFGMNFGHPDFEGPSGGLYDEPIAWWDHADQSRIDEDRDGRGKLGIINVPALGVRVSDASYGGRLDGWVIYGEFYEGWIRALEVTDDGQFTGNDVPIAHFLNMISMVEASDGTLYAAELGGTIRRMILRADRPVADEPEAALSAVPNVEEMILYDVRFPLWSNGADKSRSLYIPQGSVIDNSDPDHWIWPVGTRIYKHFEMGDESVETRVITKQEDGRWVGGVYVWEGDEAFFGDGYLTDVTVSSGDLYTIPSQVNCEECHESVRGREWPLGLQPFQLGDDGLSVLWDAGVLLEVPEEAPQSEGDPLNQAARGYLYGNCGFCHTTNGMAETTAYVTLNFDYSLSLDETEALGGTWYTRSHPWTREGPSIIDKGDGEGSVITGMIERHEMPPLSVWQHDEAAVDMLVDWINAMAD